MKFASGEKSPTSEIESTPKGRRIIFEKPAEEIKAKEIAATTKKLNELNDIERIRKELSADVNTDKTARLTEQKAALQEELTGMNPTSLEDGKSYSSEPKEWEYVNPDGNLVQLADLPPGQRKIMFDVNELQKYASEKTNKNYNPEEGDKIVKEFEDEGNTMNEVTNDLVLEENKDPVKILEVKELPEEWKGFKKEWFNATIPKNDEEYLERAKQLMGFSESLASKDPEFRKRLSDTVFMYEKNGNLSMYKGVDENGLTIKKDGTTTNYTYNLVGFSLKRADYERRVVEGYAREKGII